MKNNPLDNIKIASPCGANWNEMFGDNRKRFCSECKSNVYNISGMSQHEAENLLINSEGRVCVRLYKRHDGTILTENCPVGLAKVKQKISRVATAAFALILSFVGGVFAFFSFVEIDPNAIIEVITEPFEEEETQEISFGLYGALSNLPEIKAAILKGRNF
jgi:hypothetical protein